MAAAARPPVFSRQEVEDLWAEGRHVYICHSRVYEVDIDSLLHPGGQEVLELHRGQDISAAFGSEGSAKHRHGKAAAAMLERYYIGDLEGSSSGSGRQPEFAIDESQPLLAQVGALGPTYESWVHRTMPGQPRFFRSDLAESLTKVRWWVVPLLWLPIAGAFLWHAVGNGGNLQLPQVAALAALGVVTWQLIEYSIHRWLFHIRPACPTSIFLHFLLHGCHHKYPTDVERLVFPPVPASWAATAIWGGVRALLPQAAAHAVFGGILLGYVSYDCCHYLMHSGSLGGPLKAAHMHHHYVSDAHAYGISSPLFDWVFRTAAPIHGRQRTAAKAA